jgi:hypothetical protein
VETRHAASPRQNNVTSKSVYYPLIVSGKQLTVNSTAIPVKLERRRPAGKKLERRLPACEKIKEK